MFSNIFFNKIKNYSFAFVSVLIENNKEKEYLEFIESFEDILNTEKKLNNFLTSFSISAAKKKEFFNSISKTSSFIYFFNFLSIVIENNLVINLSYILKTIKLLLYKSLEFLITTVKSTIPLSIKEKNILKKKLEKKFNKKIYINNIIDRSLLAGYFLKVDDYIFDNSLKTKINTLKLKLIN